MPFIHDYPRFIQAVVLAMSGWIGKEVFWRGCGPDGEVDEDEVKSCLARAKGEKVSG